MLRKAASRALWLAKGAAIFWGAAFTLALLLGAGTAALAAVPGDPLKLGRINAVDAVTQLIGTRNNALLRIENASKGPDATALDLQVDPKRAPLRTNSLTKVENLHADLLDGRSASQFANGLGDGTAVEADKLDGKDADQIGVNGLERVFADSAINSNSAKSVRANCPEGKAPVGTGYQIGGGDEGDFPNVEANVVADSLTPGTSSVEVFAIEEEPIASNWRVTAIAICATAP